jgi:Transposase DDE domain
MTHALVCSVPAPVTPRAQPHRALRRWLAGELPQLRPAVAASAAACGAERYRKHFDSYAHTCVLLFHGLAGSPSLRQSYAAFAVCPGLVALSGLGGAAEERLRVSRSQLIASNTSRPPAFLGGLLPGLVARVRRLDRPAQRALPPDLHLLDSTFLRLSLRLAPWLGLSARTKRPGVCVQVQYAPARDLPEHILITDAHTTDVKGLDQALLDDPARLAALHDQTLVLDLGYYSHARFARLRRAGVHFISRLHPQAAYRVEEDRPVQAPLPGLEGGRISVLRGLRLVTARVAPTPAAARQGHQPVVYRLLTDRWDLSAAEVVQLYLWRWEIELFFRWLKSHIRLPRLLGTSPPAVELSVWLALVVHLVAVLAAHALGYPRRSPALLRQLPFALAQLTRADVAALAPSVWQLALPFPGLPP